MDDLLGTVERLIADVDRARVELARVRAALMADAGLPPDTSPAKVPAGYGPWPEDDRWPPSAGAYDPSDVTNWIGRKDAARRVGVEVRTIERASPKIGVKLDDGRWKIYLPRLRQLAAFMDWPEIP